MKISGIFILRPGYGQVENIEMRGLTTRWRGGGTQSIIGVDTDVFTCQSSSEESIFPVIAIGVLPFLIKGEQYKCVPTLFFNIDKYRFLLFKVLCHLIGVGAFFCRVLC